MRIRLLILVGFFCFLNNGWAATDAEVLKLIGRVNQVPEEQLSDKTNPGFSILRSLYDVEGPDFLTLRKLLGQQQVRARLNPSARCVLAGVISQRWDTYTLSGNLYLSGLQSKNPELRDKARRKLVAFIQREHIPVLINLLKVSGPNVLAYEVLQEVTGKRLEPNAPVWQQWWKQTQGKADLVGFLLKTTSDQLRRTRINAFSQERLWYLPEGVNDAQQPYENRSEKDQDAISSWNNWVATDVKRYVDDWSATKDILDRIVHHPDPRVTQYLERLVKDPGYGDYASVVLAWRSSRASLPIIEVASKSMPTVGRFLARGSLGDRTALVDLMRILDRRQNQPLSYKIMDDEARSYLPLLRTVGIIPAEQAFELLCHRNFDFSSAYTTKEKRKAFREAKDWMKENVTRLSLDRRRGYYVLSDQ